MDNMMTNNAYMKKGGKWIQKATASIKRRGTEGVCTGAKFGGPTCPPGSKRYNLAVTFRKMAKDKLPLVRIILIWAVRRIPPSLARGAMAKRGRRRCWIKRRKPPSTHRKTPIRTRATGTPSRGGSSPGPFSSHATGWLTVRPPRWSIRCSKKSPRR